MNARFRQFLNALSESFWVIPAAMVVFGILMAVGLLHLDRSDLLQGWTTQSIWLYNGSGTGARTLLGVIASSAIGVAGTVFSITIAALSLAAGQMGPRLLRNFTQDRGVQLTLGAFLGTFSYTLMVLRSVRTQDEGAFTPHLALTLGIVLALACVGTLVYFVAHMANRINVDTVVNLVSEDIRSGMQKLMTTAEQVDMPAPHFWANATPVMDARRGYLQELDEAALAEWCAKHGTVIRLLVRPGEYVFPNAPIAVMTPLVPGAEAAIRSATALGDTRGSGGNAEYAVRQLVEVAVRALSPGINDPHTAMTVLDRLGATLCDLAHSQMPSGVSVRDGAVALVVPSVGYKGLVNVMFHMIRQNAAANAAVLIRLLDALTAVVVCEEDPDRRDVLQHHAELVWIDAQREVGNASDREDVYRAYQRFERALEFGVLGALRAVDTDRAMADLKA
jgi:uncharacterized membrane protein